MNMVQQKNDVCKEILTILAYFNEDLLEKIPDKILKELNELAADSKANFYIDLKKNLTNQNISEESKDFISLLYYTFIADEYEKKFLLEIWDKNEYEYQKELREKYNPDHIFKNTSSSKHSI